MLRSLHRGAAPGWSLSARSAASSHGIRPLVGRAGDGFEEARGGLTSDRTELCRGGAQGSVVRPELGDIRQVSLGDEAYEAHAPVARVRRPLDEAAPLEAVDELCDRARGQHEALGEIAMGHRPVQLEVFERVEVDAGEVETPRERRAEPVSLEAEGVQEGHHLLGAWSRHVFMVHQAPNSLSTESLRG